MAELRNNDNVPPGELYTGSIKLIHMVVFSKRQFYVGKTFVKQLKQTRFAMLCPTYTGQNFVDVSWM